jgi:Domain of unknown function (DUF4395)
MEGHAVTDTEARRRTADPYRDTDVIDARAPRFNQAVVGVVSAAAVVTGWWWLLALLALQLIVGLTFGRRFCLACVFYFEVVQPRIGEGEIEDSRPPRFANILGAVFLSAATGAYAAGLTWPGRVLGGTVAALASLAAATGLCLGCEMYRVGARVRGIKPGSVHRVDLNELGVRSAGPTVVQFTHPLCTGCRDLEERLSQNGTPPVLVDISRNPALARKYRVGVVPLALRVTDDGRVIERVA